MHKQTLGLLLISTVVGLTGVVAPAWPKQALPDLPPGTSAPKTRGGGGTRGANCPSVDDYVTTMVPNVYELGGLTVEEYPTLWVYIPFPINPEMWIEVELEEYQSEAPIDMAQINVKQFRFAPKSGAAGLYGLQLSQESGSEPLQSGQTHIWSFKLYCGGKNQISIKEPAQDRAWITRIDSSTQLEAKLQAGATTVEKSNVYRDQSLWYDALDQLAIARLNKELSGEKDAAALQEAWQSLLEAAELEFVQNAPVVRLIPLISE